MGNAAAVPHTKRYPQRIGTMLIWHGNLTPSASYATNGEVITAKSLGMNNIDGGFVQGVKGARLAELVPVAGGVTALLKIQTAIGTEAVNATDQSAFPVVAQIWGH